MRSSVRLVLARIGGVVNHCACPGTVFPFGGRILSKLVHPVRLFALIPAIKYSMSPEECEFIAGNELVQIKPTFNMERVQLITGGIGPFEAGMPTWVPLWLAINLKKQRKCELIPPEWLCVEEMKNLIQAETATPAFTHIPRFYLEIARLYVEYGKDELQEGDLLRVYVQDLWDKRSSKLYNSTVKFLSQADSGHARMDNITNMEVSFIRSSLVTACQEIDNLNKTVHEVSEKVSDKSKSSER